MRQPNATTHHHKPHRRFGLYGPGSAFLVLASLAWSPSASAEIGYAIHIEGTAARMVGARKSDQFGWGGGGIVAPELTFNSRIGVELPLGGLALGAGTVQEDGFAETEEGYSLYALPGIRLRPFGRSDQPDVLGLGGLWLAGGFGLAQTGTLTRPAVDARAGFDFLAGGAVRVGPSAGWLQIVETANSLRPEDARMVLFGVHGAFEPPRSTVGEIQDLDRDDDGIQNSDDSCPDDPEDFDSHQDDDGCPEPDNDLDGILDVPDECPDKGEDFDNFKDTDGCPDLDNDDDGILDKPDACPNHPEDIDGFEDADGCPEKDNDGDGIQDMPDKCPNDPETFNGYADEDGCPDEEKVRVVGDEIVLDDRVHFRTNMAEVRVRSWPLLKTVAKLLNSNPQYTLVRIQGHADDTGATDYNARLSIKRGEQVRKVLVQYGVDAKRLHVEGFGESRPRKDGTSVFARRKNRRVEFLILQRREERIEEPKTAAELLRDARREDR